MIGDTLPKWADVHRKPSIAISAFLIICIALIDRGIEGNVAIGVLYIFPILFWGLTLTRVRPLFARSAILCVAVACAFLREAYASYHWDPGFSVRIVFTTIAFCSFGILACEINRNKALTIDSMRREQELLRSQWEADRQLRTLLQASPLSFLVTDASGEILLANDAAEQFLEVDRPLEGLNIYRLMPEIKATLSGLPVGESPSRVEIECAGKKVSGEVYITHVWFTAYRMKAGSEASELRMAFVLWDASENLRDRELAHSESLDMTARGLIAAYSHELKNLSAAGTSLISRIAAHESSPSPSDIRALEGVLRAINDFARAGQGKAAVSRHALVDLAGALEEVQLILQPVVAEAGVRLEWNSPESLPAVYADQSALSQVFLNLAVNSCRAMANSPVRNILVSSVVERNSVGIRFCDTGPGVANPDALFRPFVSDSGGAGLGLYTSRALLKSFGGELYYEPVADGSCFIVRLLRTSEESYAHSAATG